MEYQKQLGPVCVTVTNDPYILFETVELLRVFVNGEDLKSLTDNSPLCLSPEETADLARQACEGFDPSDSWSALFFKTYPILDNSKSSTCLASCIAYSFFNIETKKSELKQQLNYVTEQWNTVRRSGYQIHSINRFSIEIEPVNTEEPVRLFEELQRLPISSDFSMLLYEAFSDLDFYVERLYRLICSVAFCLEEALRPYKKRTAVLARQWIDFFVDRSVVNSFLRRGTGTVISEMFEELKIALRYFNPRMLVGGYLPDQRTAVMNIGIGVKPTLNAPAKEPQADLQKEFAAFKLLGDKGRSDIIRLLAHESRSMQDITNQLGVNPGTVFRNINSMFQAGLLSREIHGDRFYYRAKLSYIKCIFNHIIEYYQGKSPTLEDSDF